MLTQRGLFSCRPELVLHALPPYYDLFSLDILVMICPQYPAMLRPLVRSWNWIQRCLTQSGQTNGRDAPVMATEGYSPYRASKSLSAARCMRHSDDI